jgi:hypothetical protein
MNTHRFLFKVLKFIVLYLIVHYGMEIVWKSDYDPSFTRVLITAVVLSVMLVTFMEFIKEEELPESDKKEKDLGSNNS